MRGTRGRDTAPELALRRLLHARGLRYRVDAPLPPVPRRRADVLFPRLKIAVFVDGCFWHGCPEHYIPPKSNDSFWRIKVDTNRSRDQDTTERLTQAGYTVLRFWEHEPVGQVADAVQGTVLAAGRRGSGRSLPPPTVGIPDHSKGSHR